jgi:methylmalonyl-CoA mutase
MGKQTIHNILRESFPKTGKDDWERVASQELGDNKQIKNLSWQIDDLIFYPYYEEKNVENFHALKYTQTACKTWQNLPRLIVSEGKEANKRALQCLNAGADGVLFDVTAHIDFNINHLLDGIDWSACSICFFVDDDAKIATKILAYADQKGYDLTKLTGAIFWKSLPPVDAFISLIRPECTGYYPIGVTIPASSVVEEISKSLEQGVKVIDGLTDKGITKENAFRAISMSFYCDENFMVNVVKLKSVRRLWYQLSQAFEIKKYAPEDLYIHVSSTGKASTEFEPHGNMIKNTTDGLSSILGGCNALTLLIENNNDDMQRRIALNVSNILKEESHIDKVSNPLAGAYAIETMIDEISQAAWTQFQNRIRS